MLPYSVLDKSDTGTLTKLLVSAKMFCGDFLTALQQLPSEFPKDQWFAKLVQANGIVQFLEFAVEGQENTTIQALLNSFEFPTTMLSIVDLFLGIFGKESEIVFEEKPGEINISVKNANVLFSRGWETESNMAILDEKGQWILFDVFTSLGNVSLEDFFQEFMPVGVVCHISLEE